MSSLSQKKKHDKYFCFCDSMFPFDISKFVTILTHRKTVFNLFPLWWIMYLGVTFPQEVRKNLRKR